MLAPACNGPRLGGRGDEHRAPIGTVSVVIIPDSNARKRESFNSYRGKRYKIPAFAGMTKAARG